ncbi:MAG: hypothetical protein HQM13_19635 [SAR324 cluster bacterium]|nr:hypothetical protein [SAR324 cluster bacterium]
MKHKINEESRKSEDLLPPKQMDRSGIGVNYADEYLKKLNTRLEDGTPITCKRRGLRITASIGDKKGDALMNRILHGPDPKVILNRAISAAMQEAGASFTIENETMYLEM